MSSILEIGVYQHAEEWTYWYNKFQSALGEKRAGKSKKVGGSGRAGPVWTFMEGCSDRSIEWDWKSRLEVSSSACTFLKGGLTGKDGAEGCSLLAKWVRWMSVNRSSWDKDKTGPIARRKAAIHLSCCAVEILQCQWGKKTLFLLFSLLVLFACLLVCVKIRKLLWTSFFTDVFWYHTGTYAKSNPRILSIKVLPCCCTRLDTASAAGLSLVFPF